MQAAAAPMLGILSPQLPAAQGTDEISPEMGVRVHSHLELEISPLVIPLLALAMDISPAFRLLP